MAPLSATRGACHGRPGEEGRGEEEVEGQEEEEKEEGEDPQQQGDCEQGWCAVCLQEPSEAARLVTPCGHVFCDQCLKQWYSLGKKECPCCRHGLRSFGRRRGLLLEEREQEGDDGEGDGDPPPWPAAAQAAMFPAGSAVTAMYSGTRYGAKVTKVQLVGGRAPLFTVYWDDGTESHSTQEHLQMRLV